MDIKPDDVVYLIAIRARVDDGGRSVREVLKAAGFPQHGEYSAHVVARPLSEAYSVEDPERPGRIRQAQNMNDVLLAAGFDFDSANQVVPVATVSPA